MPCAMTPPSAFPAESPSRRRHRGDRAAHARRACPRPFADSLGDIVLQIEEFADPTPLAASGSTIRCSSAASTKACRSTDQSVSNRARCPNASRSTAGRSSTNGGRTRISLEQLVSHIVIHEVGHHFGFSDDDMHALEDGAE